MAENPKYTRTAAKSSRRVYLLRRLAGGSVLIALIFLIFVRTSDWLLYAGIFAAAAVVLWFMASGLEKRSEKIIETDEKGNVKKTVL